MAKLWYCYLIYGLFYMILRLFLLFFFYLCQDLYCCNKSHVVNYHSRTALDEWQQYVASKAYKLTCEQKPKVESYALCSIKNTISCALSLFNNDECSEDCANIVFLKSLMDICLLKKRTQICELTHFLRECIKATNLQNKIDVSNIESTFFLNFKVDTIDDKINIIKDNIARSLGLFLFVKSVYIDIYNDKDGLYMQAIARTKKLEKWMENVN